MKVHETSFRGIDGESALRKPERPASEKTDFQGLLKEELSGTASAAVTHKKAASPELHALFQPCPHLMMNLVGEQELMEQSAHGLRKVLDALETLEVAFTHSATTPRNIEQQLQGIHRELSQLKPLLEELPEGHPLQTMGEELQILAHVESIKWNRGDYL